MPKPSVSKINYFFTNLNLIIILVGYPLFTSIFIPLIGNVEGSSQIVTIPFRIFSLGITLIVLALNIKSSIKFPIALKLFIFFWFLLLIRMFYDLEVRTDYFIFDADKQRVWLIAIFVCFIPMISLIKSFKSIDFNFCLKYVYASVIIILLISFFYSLKVTELDDRASGNIAFDTISFGQFAVLAVIISIYKFLTDKVSNHLIKIGYLLTAILGIFIALKSGSRGPLVALFGVLIFWYSFKFKNNLKVYLFFGVSILITILSFSLILYIIGLISPLTAFRIKEGLSGDDMSVMARQESYAWFVNKILESPIVGSQFARFGNGEYPGYAHNILLDILLGFGILGLLLFLYIIIKALKNIRVNLINNQHYWIGLILLQSFILSLTSGAYYSNPILNCCIVLTLLISYKTGIKKAEDLKF